MAGSWPVPDDVVANKRRVFLTSSRRSLAMFGMAKAGSKRLATNEQSSNTRRFKKRVLKVKSPASEGKYDASGASTFRATGDHFWIAVTQICKNDANSLD